MFPRAISIVGTEKIACGAKNWSKTSNFDGLDQDLKINDYVPLVIDNLKTRGAYCRVSNVGRSGQICQRFLDFF